MRCAGYVDPKPKFDFSSLTPSLIQAGSGLAGGLAQLLMQGGSGQPYSAGTSLAGGRITPFQLAQWLAALSSDAGKMKL